MELALPTPAVGVSSSAQRERIPFRFTGTGAEYFRIWIVNLLLTLTTLGIYSAWAKVRRLRYFYGNTSLAGSSFEYHAQPIQILKGRLIAVGALAIYSASIRIWPASMIVLLPLVILALPWVIVRSRKFQMQVTSWRNIRFRFHGTYGQAAAAYIGWAIVSALTLNLMMPRLLYARVKFLLGETSFGSQKFEFTRQPGPYYRFFYLTLLLSLGAVLAVLIILVVIGLIVGVGVGLTGAATTGTMTAVLIQAISIGAFLIVYLPILAYYESRFVNTTLDGLKIGPHTVRCNLETNRLASIYVTNVLGMIFTLGLYYPWARIRRMQYQLDSMSVDTVGSLDMFTAAADSTTSATGEELGEFFDVDFGF